MKHFISVDTDKQAVICSIGRKSHVNDNKLFRPIARKTRAITKVSIPPTKVGGFTASQPTAFTEG
jgi:hypothetical protein